MTVSPVSFVVYLSLMKLRSKPRLDYRQLHNTGARVLKMEGEHQGNDKVGIMKGTELKTREDLNFCLEIYEDVNDFTTKSEVLEAIKTVSELFQVYRHVNADLKIELGDDEYNQNYPDYDETVKKATVLLKGAHKRIKEVRDDTFKPVDNQRELLDIDKEVLDMKVKQLTTSVDISEEVDVLEVETYIQRLEGFVSDFFDLSGKSKALLGGDHDQEVFDTSIESLTEKVNKAKISRKNLLSKDAKNESEAAKICVQNDHILRGTNLSGEITQRLKILEAKFDQNLDGLGDYQILEISQSATSLDSDFNTILEKITDLAGLVSGGGEEVQKLLTTAVTTKDTVFDKKTKFCEQLQSIVTERDVTSDKLKNAASLKIDLPPFSGYDCQMDIYTFKSEFKKLVEPIVQKQFHSDYLKRNYLTGPALNLVEKMTDYSEIWKKLLDSFGNARLLLQNKLAKLDDVGGLWKAKGDEKIANTLASVINTMTELSALATEHSIEGQLYEGGGLEKVMSLIGENRHRKFRGQNLDMDSSKKVEWGKLMNFLEQEKKWRDKVVLDTKSAKLMGIELRIETKKSGPEKSGKKPALTVTDGSLRCHFCDEGQHTVVTTAKGNKIIPYYVCGVFVAMSPAERFSQLKSKGFCTTCLLPGAIRGPRHKCFFLNFCCPQTHSSPVKIHVLLCEEHKNDDANKKLVEKFKDKFVKNCKQNLPQFSQNLSLISVTVNLIKQETSLAFAHLNSRPDVRESAIFLLQTIVVESIRINLFFDNGCGDLVIRHSLVEKLSRIGRANLEIEGPIPIIGVGDHKTDALGFYSISLPLHDGENVTMSGVCIPKITSRFPVYDLKKVESDLRTWCSDDHSCKFLPKLSAKVGGDTDILIGSKYLRYFPKIVYEHETGLRIHKSVFKSACGSRGVVEGPHPKFSEIERKFHGNHSITDRPLNTYFTYPAQVIRSLWGLGLNLPLLGSKIDPKENKDFPPCCSHIDSIEKEMASFPDPDDDPGKKSVRFLLPSPENSDSEVVVSNCEGVQESLPVSSVACVEGGAVSSGTEAPTVTYRCVDCQRDFDSGDAVVALVKKPPKCLKQFDAIELTGTEVTYRCVDCRGCLKCKNGPQLESVSIQEEIEERLIERCVTVDVEEGRSSARLPFVVDPDKRIAVDEQREMALKVFKAQVRNLSTREEDRVAVVESEQKLQDLGFVDWVSNLSDEQKALVSSDVYYMIPWRAVHNENSVSTPCRLVFDASQGTRSGCSLNSMLAKGINSLNSLVGIILRWTTYPHVFTTDVSKMYNRVNLDPEHWKYQLYFWSDGLEPGVEPEPKAVKSVIYGVRSSGNVAQCALRRTVELCQADFPRAVRPILEDTYMDDCISGTGSSEETRLTVDDIQNSLLKGGFFVKGFAFSGEPPPEVMSNGADFLLVGGQKWFSEGDLIGLNLSELNFSRKVRGKKGVDGVGIVPEILTKTNCVSRSSEVFDIQGLVAPILGGIKIDVSELHKHVPKWDDPIPSQFKEIWVKNFEVIDELRHLRYRRAVVPSDALNLDIETIEIADAGERLICAAIYVRFKRRNGTHSCQLIMARTKVIHDLSIPRAELEAALLNTSTGHLVRLSLKERVKRSWKLTDSQVALHWINCIRYALKMWVRNRVVEINRLTQLESWYYVGSKQNIADLGTRKGAQISDVGPDSCWINGLPWMKGLEHEFPLQKVEDLILSVKEKSDANKEKVVQDLPDESFLCLTCKYVPNELGDRYAFSKYLIDPNKFRFTTVIRILALVFVFLKKLNDKRNQRYGLQKPLSFLRKRDFNVRAMNSGVGQFFVGTIHVAPKPVVAIVQIPEVMINASKAYFFEKASAEVLKFVDPKKYKKISTLNDRILYHTGRILLVQEIDDRSHIADACLDLSARTFCVPVTDHLSPVAYAIVADTHWYSLDVSHGGIESVLRYAQQTAYVIEGRSLVKGMKKACPRCRYLEKKGVRVAMGPVSDDNLRIAPAFFVCQVDICGPFSAYSPANKRATLKIWYVVFCCTVTGATDCRVMEDYSADGFILAFIRFACRFGYPKKLLPDPGSQLVKGCKDMVISMSSITQKLSVEYGVEFTTCPVGAHNYHGKVERKIQQIKKSLAKHVNNKRLSIIQWETLGQQVSNSINNLPIGLGNKTELLESLDILTPNRLILGRNNDRSPTAPLEVSHDLRKIVASNNDIYRSWFKEWMVSHVPSLIDQPKWFVTDRSIAIGDVVLFLKSEKQFDLQYQYGLVVKTYESKDGLIRSVEVEYQNPGESVKRRTNRGVRDLVVIHQVDEVGISKELHDLANANNIEQSDL